MPEHVCPFCAAPLGMASVPPGARFRCGGCGQALEAGETRLSSGEVRGYRGRQRVRRLLLCMIAADAAAVVAYFAPWWPDGMEGWVRWLATACAALMVGPVLFVVASRRPDPVPVAPPLDKVRS